jgi:hypothetical protein
MRRALLRCGIIALAVVASIVHPGNATAGFPVPSPANSSLPPCIATCPLGDLPIQVVVRDFSNVPIVNSVVQLDFCACSGAHFCPPAPGDGYLFATPCAVQAVTNAFGVVTFSLHLGGSCTGLVTIYADGVVLGTRHYASTDQNGDLAVDNTDVGILTAKLGGSDPSGDLDCSGFVQPPDLTILLAHQGHLCSLATGLKQTYWGGLKIRYR